MAKLKWKGSFQSSVVKDHWVVKRLKLIEIYRMFSSVQGHARKSCCQDHHQTLSPIRRQFHKKRNRTIWVYNIQ